MSQRILCAAVMAAVSGLIFLDAVQAAQTKHVVVKLKGKKVATGAVGPNWTALYTTKSGYRALARFHQGRLEARVLDPNNRSIPALKGTQPPLNNPSLRTLSLVDTETGTEFWLPIPPDPDPDPFPYPRPRPQDPGPTDPNPFPDPEQATHKLKVPARK